MEEKVTNVPAKESIIDKAKTFFKSAKWKEIWDKITTGILIFLMASPILILAYIFIWFLTK